MTFLLIPLPLEIIKGSIVLGRSKRFPLGILHDLHQRERKKFSKKNSQLK